MRSIDLHCIQRGPCKWLPAWTTVCYTVVTSTYLPKRGHMAPGTVASSRCSNRERSFTSMHSHLVALALSAYTTPLYLTWPVYALPAWTTVCYTVVTSTYLPKRGHMAPGTVAPSRVSNMELSFTSMHSHLVALSPSTIQTHCV